MRPSYWCLAAALLVTAGATGAQVPSGGRPIVTGIGEIHGKLADSASGRAISTGSITIRRAGPDTSFAGGALPKPDGSFRVDGLTAGRYTLRYRALGFAPVIRTGIVIAPDKPIVDVGTIQLIVSAAKLGGQEVTAERDDEVLSPDRNSYSAKNMTTAAGGTAIDVLRNIPSVEVDGSNNVTLRGNANVVVQINGRATPLKGDQLGAFLAQLPANTVKNVEVATNPSAKNDPEGTAGIINIVLNQEAELGLSGGVSAGTATTGQVSVSGNVGKQQGGFTAFASGSIYRDHRNISGTIDRTNLLIASPAYVQTILDGNQQPLSGGGTLRTEYRFNEKNAINLDGYAYGGKASFAQSTDYTDLDITRSTIGQFNQGLTQDSRNSNQDVDVAFHHQNTSKPLEMQYHLDAEYSNSHNDIDLDLSGVVVRPDASTPAFIPTENDHAVYRFPTLNLKFDYTQPFGPATKLEAGLKETDRTTSNDFTPNVLTNGAFVLDNVRHTDLSYREQIGAGYAVLSHGFGPKVQTQTGLRFEHVDTRLDIPLQSILSTSNYTSFYPSAIVSYNVSQLRQAKLSYSRRVSRPFPTQLSPAIIRIDTRTVQHGNPNLKPEYTDAFELNLTDAHTWGSLQVNPYLRHTGNAVRNIQFVDSLGITTSVPDNVASTVTVGSDVNATVRHGGLTLFGGGSIYHYHSNAATLTTTTRDLSTDAVSWSLRANSTYKFNNFADMQLFANYRAPFKTEGGSQLASVNLNLAYRYKVWGDAGSVSVRVSDPFNMTKFGYRLENGAVIETSERYFGIRGVYFSVTRNFGTALKLRQKQDSDAQQPAVGGISTP